KVTYQDGVVISEELVSEEVTLHPVDTIIEYGTKEEPVITTEKRTETQDIDFKVERIANPDLPKGEERVVQDGVMGVIEFIYEQTFKNGVLVDEVLISENITLKHVNKII